MPPDLTKPCQDRAWAAEPKSSVLNTPGGRYSKLLFPLYSLYIYTSKQHHLQPSSKAGGTEPADKVTNTRPTAWSPPVPQSSLQVTGDWHWAAGMRILLGKASPAHTDTLGAHGDPSARGQTANHAEVQAGNRPWDFPAPPSHKPLAPSACGCSQWQAQKRSPTNES